MTPAAAPTTPVHCWHNLAISDVLTRHAAAPDKGLTPNEAVRRLAEHGPNTLPETKHRSLWRVFAGQFASPLIYILYVAAVITFA
ncbi:cation-transporting P-type ATPase [Prosthecobacter sp.]|uniref:cation-transporting P-type ATPase n=1 Tax=Prosthecobacter sp. TaxID=1965333 RepID=UPI0024871497|nr:cation-transporting P-type ATPase [Prosthecobacter sp.]MDI1313710.1 cation-transporting P-type ATPase [Prosthecobacter sp.]